MLFSGTCKFANRVVMWFRTTRSWLGRRKEQAVKTTNRETGMTPESSSALAGLAALNHGILVEVRQLLRKEPKAMESHLAMMSDAADVLRDAPDSALDRAAHTGVCVMVVNKDYIERAIDGRSTPTPLPGFTAEGAQQILAINAALLNALDEFIRLEQSRAQIAFSAPPAICDMVRAVDPIA